MIARDVVITSYHCVRIPFRPLLSWEQAVAIELSQLRKVDPSSFHALFSRGISIFCISSALLRTPPSPMEALLSLEKS